MVFTILVYFFTNSVHVNMWNTHVNHDAGSKFVRGGISVASVTVVCFDFTRDKMEAERAELIASILIVAKLYILCNCVFFLK